MPPITRIQSEETLKILGDTTRLAMLRLLIAHPATLSQLGAILGKHPAQIRNHILQLERVGLVTLDSVVQVRNYQEKYYKATAQAFFVNMPIFGQPSTNGQVIILGSDDLALELLAQQVSRQEGAPQVCVLPAGSLDGLIFLREKYSQISGCHLFDSDSGEYNLPYVRHLFGEEKMLLVTLSHRQQGLFVRRGNPLHITTIDDLARPEVTLVNRKRGTGTRLWLEQALRKHNIDHSAVHFTPTDAGTHADVAQTVAAGRADVGLGIFAAAQRFDLDFVPLFTERYDLVMSEETFATASFQPIYRTLQEASFQQSVARLGGYDTRHTGAVIRV